MRHWKLKLTEFSHKSSMTGEGIYKYPSMEGLDDRALIEFLDVAIAQPLIVRIDVSRDDPEDIE